MMFKNTVLIFNTIKYLRLTQLIYRAKRKFYKPKPLTKITLEVSNILNPVKPFIKREQKMIGIKRFRFLNKEGFVNSSIDWNSSNQEKLWLYNLHYFDDLISVNSDQRKNFHIDLIQNWIEENPIGYGNGSEPYPTSLRIVNWIKWSLVGNTLKNEWLDSLAIQVDFLSKNIEYHLLGNHLFSNAKALIFAGLYFQGDLAQKWYKLGMKIFMNEIHEQVLSDGGNFELSPMYHSIFLEDILDIINIHQVYSKNLDDGIIDVTKKMFFWLNKMTHPDGRISFFNDSAHGISAEIKDFENYFKLLKIDIPEDDKYQLIHLEASGYIRAENENSVLIADIAEIGPKYLPAHGHADTLSFELSLFGQRVIVNSGTSTYEPGEERNLQRGTRAHSTITVDNANSSEVWGVFRVARRAEILNIYKNLDMNGVGFSACHDGYKRINKNIIHCREWILSDNLLKVFDHVSGSNRHSVNLILPLHPEVSIINVYDNYLELKVKQKVVKIKFQGYSELNVRDSKYYPEFGLSIKNKQVECNYNGSLPLDSQINISW